MFVTIMKSKIHRATVTQAELHYEGSITIDEDLLDAADIVVGERVQVVNLQNGERLETYTIAGERGSGVIGLNGPAALKCRQGDVIHVISYAMLDLEQARRFTPKVFLLDENNHIEKWLSPQA